MSMRDPSMSPETSGNPTLEAFRVNAKDNVATLLASVPAREIFVTGERPTRVVLTREIEAAHKVALEAIAQGGDIIKFGQPIGYATEAIRPGDWVHLHNMASHYDERAGRYDVKTGVPDDNEDSYV